MAIGRYYTIEFTNIEGTFCKALIGDSFVQTTGTPQIIPLEPSESPIVISNIDNDEAKFTSIRAQQATLSFISTQSLGLATFSDGPDDRFPVTILYGTTIVFYGFLSLTDNSEAFLPARNIVTLTATDKLGALKDIPLTDSNGDNPQGMFTIAELVAMCLKKTGLDLEIRVMQNLRHGTGQKQINAGFGEFDGYAILMSNADASFFYAGQRVQITGTTSNNVEFTVFSVSTGIVGGIMATEAVFTTEGPLVATFTDLTSQTHFYQHYLDVKTFEEDLGASENCYDVLSKILGYDCFITQYKECWWICRVEEYERGTFYITRFTPEGTIIDSYADTANLNKSIGFNQTHWFSQEQTTVSPTRPINFAKLTYRFNFPSELLCNVDFSRGTIDDPTDTTADETITGTPECWTLYANHFDGSEWVDGTPQAGARGELVKRYEYGYEKDRYLLVEHEDVSGDDEVHYFKSTPVDMRQGDKVNLTVDFRVQGVSGLTSLNPVQVTLVPHNGTDPWYWSMDDLSGVNEWVQRATPTTNPFSTTIRWQGTDSDQYHSVGGESLPLPADGLLYVRLATNFNIFAPYLFTNLRFDYTPFINGSYRKYSGRYEKVARSETGYLSSVDDEVFLSDAEIRLLKGALQFFDGTKYQLTRKWYDASKTALAYPTDLTTVKPFGNHQAFAVWNQYRLANTIFEFSIDGFGDDIPSLVHKYEVKDISTLSVNRYYMMLAAEKDLMRCRITGKMEQCYHTVDGKSYDDDHEFKYIV